MEITSANALSFFTGIINIRIFPRMPFEQSLEMSKCRIAARKNHSMLQEFMWIYAGMITMFAVLMFPLVQIFRTSGDAMLLWAGVSIITQLLWLVAQLPFSWRWIYSKSLALKMAVK